jgi:hypothetical protein
MQFINCHEVDQIEIKYNEIKSYRERKGRNGSYEEMMTHRICFCIFIENRNIKRSFIHIRINRKIHTTRDPYTPCNTAKSRHLDLFCVALGTVYRVRRAPVFGREVVKGYKLMEARKGFCRTEYLRK